MNRTLSSHSLFSHLLIGGGLLAVGLGTSPAWAGFDHSLVIDEYAGTQTCLNCHGEDGITGDKAAEVMHTIHWTWEHTNRLSTGETQDLGKRKMVNDFCMATPSNEYLCSSCHIGLGWSDDSFDFSDPKNVDCLVCHDTTGTYEKHCKPFAGFPPEDIDLTYVARHVGPTSRQTCGNCHFFGGGDAVKHGDLDTSLRQPTREVDVHMGTDGGNHNCAFCHDEGEHQVRGSRYSKPAPDNALCENCHTNDPHDPAGPGSLLNIHTARVACQTCHVPEFARGGVATKMHWDWSTAGEFNEDGSFKIITDDEGHVIYHTQKGSFVWKANVKPEYRWFNGDVRFTTLDDVINPDQVVTINQLMGDVNDPRARIVPVKHFTGRQPYDAGRGTLAAPHLFPRSPDDTDAYWMGFDWLRSLAAGMEATGREFSGELGWVDTEMFWIQNHMVAPKEQALTCADCHTPRGRLDFLALGYPEERARELQTMLGFEVAFSVEPQAGGVKLTWTGREGYRYQVQTADSLEEGAVWTNVPGGIRVPTQPVEELSWTDDLAGAPAVRFYRVWRSSLGAR